MPRDADNLEFAPEKLESRQMLAGDVNVALQHGDLVVNGDHDGNRIQITQDNFGRTTVQGLNGTYINGSYNGSMTVRVEDDFRINLKHGDNSVFFGTFPTLGNTRIRVPDDLTIRTGGGDDLVSFWGLQVGDDVSITTGQGSNRINGLNFGNTSADEVGDDLRIKSQGSAEIDLHWSIGDDATITTGHQADIVNLWSLDVADKLSIRTGGGQDQVLMQDTHVYGKTNVATGSGNDYFTWYGSSGAHDDVRLSMGHGYDVASFSAFVYYGSELRKTGVEVG